VARYTSQLTSSAALTSGTAFAWLGYSSTVGFRLRRVILGVIAGSSAVASQQLQVGINPTHAGSQSTPVNATSFAMNSAFAANSNNLISAWTTAPTLNASDEITLTFNSQSGGDWPWEIPEDLFPPYAPAGNVGFAFVNRVNTMPAGSSFTITVEYEEL
jgi:hypothetical protein